MKILVSGSTKTVGRLMPKWRDCLGRLLTPDSGNRVPTDGADWAADNAAFTAFDPAGYCRMLGRVAGKPGLLWVAAPDRVGDAVTTREQFHRWRHVFVQLGVVPAYVGQDGAEDIEHPWDLFGCWFVGGSTKWKLSRASNDLAYEAKRRGKLLHVGRVNSFRRLEVCHEWNADTVDGTGYSMYADALLPGALERVRGMNLSTQMRMFA